MNHLFIISIGGAPPWPPWWKYICSGTLPFSAIAIRTLCSGTTFQSLKAWAIRTAALIFFTFFSRSRSAQKAL